MVSDSHEANNTMSTDWVAMFGRSERGSWRAKGLLVLVILPHVFWNLGDGHCSEQLAFTVNAERGCIKRFDSTVSHPIDTLPHSDIVQSALLSSQAFSATSGQTLGSGYHWRCEGQRSILETRSMHAAAAPNNG